MYYNIKKQFKYLKSRLQYDEVLESNIKFNAGFAVLFAVLLASFLITLGISIFSVSLREIQISTSVRDSQIAYYAADSALECAKYWDKIKWVFPYCEDSSCSSFTNLNGDTVSLDPSSSYVVDEVKCNNIPIKLSFNRNSLTYTVNQKDFFKFSSSSISAPISDITISKQFGNPPVTLITANGHNTGIIGRRAERGIKQQYNN